MTLTIGVKALNEEAHIGDSLRSALAAAAPFGGDVVLADSGSTDRTLEIARSLPVRIVQLADPSERSCGTGAQLAFQHASGDYFYLLDGDMVLAADFLPAAVAFLEANPEFAAVGGLVHEANTEGQEFQIRAKTVRTDPNWLPGVVDRLDCGGLYRAAAVRECGYFADRNLHAFEEFELAARLRSRGWKLARIDALAVQHYGHQIDGYRLLWRRLASGYAGAPGQVLRGALGKRHLPAVLGGFSHLRIGLSVVAWWLLLAAAAAAPLPPLLRLAGLLLLVASPATLLTWRRGSLRLGLYSLASWNVSALGLILGLVRRRRPPEHPIAANLLASPQSLET